MTRPLLFTLALLLALPTLAPAQPAPPRMQSSTSLVSILVGERLWKNHWQVANCPRPHVFEVALPDGQPQTVKFFSRTDSLSLRVADKQSQDIVIQYNGRDCATRVVGKTFAAPKGLVLDVNFDFAREAARMVRDNDFPSAALARLQTMQASAGLLRKMQLKDFSQLVEHLRKLAADPKMREAATAVMDEFAKGDAGKYANLGALVRQSLAPYVPPELGAHVQLYFLFGGNAGGFAFGGDDTYVNLAAYVDASKQDLAETVTHEVFHAIQGHVVPIMPTGDGDVTPTPEATGTEPIWAQTLLYNLVQEGTAELFTHSVQEQPQTKNAREQKARIERNARRLRGIFTLFETLTFRLVYAPPADADGYDRIYGLMFYGNWDATAYDLGWTMAHAIEEQQGKAALFNVIKQDPKEFILHYQAIAAKPDSKLPRFSDEFIALVRDRL